MAKRYYVTYKTRSKITVGVSIAGITIKLHIPAAPLIFEVQFLPHFVVTSEFGWGEDSLIRSWKTAYCLIYDILKDYRASYLLYESVACFIRELDKNWTISEDTVKYWIKHAIHYFTLTTYDKEYLTRLGKGRFGNEDEPTKSETAEDPPPPARLNPR